MLGSGVKQAALPVMALQDYSGDLFQREIGLQMKNL
tara:strand:- start:182 stop:289 length:108 start_codon:yes stop_codon:yes gene_type:complete